MKTIFKILDYHLNSDEEMHLRECGIVNGCGGSGGMNLEPYIKEYIEKLSGFDKEKGKILFQDIKKICIEHDIDFRFARGFYKSNFIFARKIYKLFHKFGVKNQLKVSFLVFFLLNRYGQKYYIYK